MQDIGAGGECVGEKKIAKLKKAFENGNHVVSCRGCSSLINENLVTGGEVADRSTVMKRGVADSRARPALSLDTSRHSQHVIVPMK